METDTRSVAEIIGWTPEHVWHNHDCVYCGAYEISAKERECPCEDGGRFPTVDDMLAWLRARGIGWMELHWEDHEEWFVHMLSDGPDITAPTLHAALEAAVRAVAAETALEEET